MISASEIYLPALRDDLEFYKDTRKSDGSNMWVIHDPLQHRYFQIDETTQKIFSIWRGGLTIKTLIELVQDEYSIRLDEAKLFKLYEFVRTSNLANKEQLNDWRELHQRAESEKIPFLTKLIQGHLFFRIPILRPHKFISWFQPIVEPLFSKKAMLIVGFIGILGLYLISRQWDIFIGSFLRAFSTSGLLYFAIALPLVKIAHEFGHAFTAARYGCRVSTMGVAFMMFFPILYTDVSDSWRVATPKQRMKISAAGVIVELAIAMIATFLWAFLDNGATRDIAFALATTGWIVSLGVNLNPCMKFDGYYILSDWLGIENMQSRAFALGRWKLQQVFFAPSLSAPENFNTRTQMMLIAYAFGTWIYRLIIFTTLALLAYHYTFKLLGIALFILEIWLLVVRPIFRELMNWRKIDAQNISSKRLATSATLCAVIIFSLIIPWSTNVQVPAVLQAADLTQLYAPKASKVTKIHTQSGERIEKGDPILTLENPQLTNQIELTRIRLQEIRLRLGRAISDRKDRDNLIVLKQEQSAALARLDGLKRENRELIIRAPISGTILQMEKNLHTGRWIGKNTMLALIASGHQHVIRGYVDEDNRQRIEKHTSGKFIPDDLTRAAIPVHLDKIASASSSTIEDSELIETNGGKIAVSNDTQEKITPLAAQYLIELSPQHISGAPNQIVRGIVQMRGNPESAAMGLWKQFARILIRESGL